MVPSQLLTALDPVPATAVLAALAVRVRRISVGTTRALMRAWLSHKAKASALTARKLTLARLSVTAKVAPLPKVCLTELSKLRSDYS